MLTATHQSDFAGAIAALPNDRFKIPEKLAGEPRPIAVVGMRVHSNSYKKGKEALESKWDAANWPKQSSMFPKMNYEIPTDLNQRINIIKRFVFRDL